MTINQDIIINPIIPPFAASKTTVYCLTRICTLPNAAPVSEGEQRRYITRTGPSLRLDFPVAPLYIIELASKRRQSDVGLLFQSRCTSSSLEWGLAATLSILPCENCSPNHARHLLVIYINVAPSSSFLLLHCQFPLSFHPSFFPSLDLSSLQLLY